MGGMSSSLVVQSIPIENKASLPYFPRTIENMDENEALTFQTWRELFAQAVAKPLPAYVIAIARLPPLPPDTKPRYRVYDGVALRNYVAASEGRIDPIARCAIQEIHYFAIRCFTLKNGQITPVELGSQTFRPFLPSIAMEKRRIQGMIKQYFPQKRFSISEEKQMDADMQKSLQSLSCKGLVRGEKIRPIIEKMHTYALDGANLHCQDQTALGQCQFIVGHLWHKLFHADEEKVWMWCAQKNMPAHGNAGI